METEINIAEILKNKPKGTKLYSPIFGEVKYDNILLGDIKVLYSCTDRHFYMDGKFCMNGECLLFPSKEMRDWSKFAWKKGDVLISNNGNNNIIFIKFTDDTYTHFKGKHLCENSVLTSAYAESRTMDYCLADYSQYSYINLIEKTLGGKLNLKTLEVEKTQPKFKDGDILTSEGDCVFIFKKEVIHGYLYYAGIGLGGSLCISTGNTFCGKDENIRYASVKEKTKLFEALTKEGKRWNAEKKILEAIKKEHQFQPLDYVLSNDNEDNEWTLCQFSHFDKKGNAVFVGGSYADKGRVILPYEGNEHLLGTTKDVKG